MHPCGWLRATHMAITTDTEMENGHVDVPGAPGYSGDVLDAADFVYESDSELDEPKVQKLPDDSVAECEGEVYAAGTGMFLDAVAYAQDVIHREVDLPAEMVDEAKEMIKNAAFSIMAQLKVHRKEVETSIFKSIKKAEDVEKKREADRMRQRKSRAKKAEEMKARLSKCDGSCGGACAGGCGGNTSK